MRALDRIRETLVTEARTTRVKAVEDFLRSESFKYMRMGFTLDDIGAGFASTIGQLKKAKRLTPDFNFDEDLDIDADENKETLVDKDIPMSVLKADEFWPLVCPKEEPLPGSEDLRVPLVPRFPKWVPSVLVVGCLEATEE